MHPRKKFQLKLPSGVLLLGERTLVMGVLNITPDSFSDGGEFFSSERAIDHALAMERDGADLIDIGAESTRPGSSGISQEEELARLLPVLRGLRGRLKIPISIDTQKSGVAEAVIDAGAQILNDISALRTDPRIAEVAARRKVPLILMHMHGSPATMQKGPFAKNALQEVLRDLRVAIAKARKAGVAKSQLVVDPGIGFGKSFAQNYQLLGKLDRIAALGCPILVGTSRKAFLGATLARDGKPAAASERLWATAATVTAAILHGAHMVRVHDVPQMQQVVWTADHVLNPQLSKPRSRGAGNGKA
jgi:dihydropteroate synthase